MRRLHPNRLSEFDISEDLLPIDRIYQRWARSVGCGMPQAEWDGTASRPTELPPDAAVWVDRYVCTRPRRMKKFLHAWYRSQSASASIARQFGLSRDAVYSVWRMYLAASRADFFAEPCIAPLMQRTHLEAA